MSDLIEAPMHRFLALALAAAVYSLINASAAFGRGTTETMLDGACVYPESVTQYASETTLITCDSARIAEADARITIEFRQRSWGTFAQFAGVWQNGSIMITGLRLRDGRDRQATGICRIDYRGDRGNGDISNVACRGKYGTRFIAANFLRSRVQM